MLALALVLALGQALPSPEGPIFSQPSLQSAPWFQAFPASGAGLPYAQNLCDQLSASEKVGNWWCLNGDGTMASGSTRTLSPAGSPVPTTSTDTVCPSGPSCSTVTSQRFAAGGGYADSASTTAPNAFTACLVFSPDSLANINFFGKVGTSAATIQWLFQQQTSGRVDFGVSNGTTFSLYAQGPASSLAIAGSVHVACARYVYSGTPGASSAAQMCFDGTCGTASAVAIGPLNTASIATRIGFDTTYIYTGRVFGAFVTDADLGTTRIAAIAHAVLADAPTGAKGEAVTLTRSTPQGCIDSTTGAGSIVPANRMCVVEGGTTAAQGSFVQYLARTAEMNNAAWVALTGGVAAPSVTPDYAVAPDGTKTAERLVVPACPVAGNYSFIEQQFPSTTTGTHRPSLWVKGTGSVSLCGMDIGGAAGNCTTVTATSEWQRYAASTTVAAAGSATRLEVGCINLSSRVGSGDTGAADVQVWGANMTAGPTLRPYIPATSSGVTTGTEVATVTLSGAPALNSVDLTIDTPTSMGSTPYLLNLYKDANNQLIMYANSSLYCWYLVGGVGYTGSSVAGIPLSTNDVRLSCSYDGTNVIACVNGSCTSTARSFTMFTGATKLAIGEQYAGGFESNPMPVIKNVRADPNPGRFR